MAKPHIEKSSKTFLQNSPDTLLVGSNQVSQETDLFYEIEPAEVLWVIYTIKDLETFNLLTEDETPDKSLLNSCVVRKLYTETNQEILNERGSELRQFMARPFDSNILRLPIKGEVVPIINFISSNSTTNLNRKISYYMSNINSWNSSHQNSLPNISALDALENTTSESVKKPEDGNPFIAGAELPDLGEYFTERNDIKRTQLYEGDILFEGRFGQHIRLGSSDKILEENPNWWSEGSEETLGKPVTIISNGQSIEKTSEFEPRDLYASDFNKDSSTIILTENQPTTLDVSYLELDNDDAILKTLGLDLVADTQNPTIQMNSGTIMLNARDNKLLGFAKDGIGLVTTGDMSIDVTNKWSTVSNEKDEEMLTSYKMTTPHADLAAKKSNLGENAVDGKGEPMVLGDTLVDVLTKLIDGIPKYIFVGGGGPHPNQAGNPGEILHKQLKTQLKTILSKNHTLD